MKKSVNTPYALIIGLIAATVIFRIIPHPFNITPVLAAALFAGARVSDKKWAFTLPAAAMFISDAALAYMNNYPLFHSTIIFVYGALLLSVLIGRTALSGEFNAGKTALTTIASSVLFFIITNLGVWLMDGMYSLDFSGLTTCFIMAVPFFKYSIAGDLFFVTVLFGVYELATRKTNVLAKKSA